MARKTTSTGSSRRAPRKPKVAKKWIRGPVDELAIKQGCWFDEKAGLYAVNFIERYCRQSVGRWGGQPLFLLEWQRDFLMRLFGWKLANGKRRFLRAYLEVAKKNGKSTLFAAIAILLLVGDGEGAPEVYINACDREQASIIFDESSRMVHHSPALNKRLKVIDSKKRIIDPKNSGRIQANSADVPSKDGRNAHGILFDELHRQRTRDLWDIFEYAAESREQPLTLSITTAGEEEAGIWYEQREYSEGVNEGRIPDITHLGVVYRALPTDDLGSEATWKKANPSLGITIDTEKFRRAYEEALVLPRKMALFKRLRLNIIASMAAKFMPPEVWARCKGDFDPRMPLPRGVAFWAGLDLSSIQDLTALAVIFGSRHEGYRLLTRFWLPAERIVELEHEHSQPYRAWAQHGYITLTEGEVVDYDFVRREINNLAAVGELRKLLVDPHNATNLATELIEQDGIPAEFLGQGFISLNAPTKELERLALSRKLRHGGHPVMDWMMRNAVVQTDAAGNIKLTKKKSSGKIDGAAATVNAIAALLAPDAGPSVYESRGLLSL
jgi:phage terminase large subunit-like protein